MKPFSYICNVERKKLVRVDQRLNFGNGGFANGTAHQKS
jgi:hypothetical protein